MTQKTITLANPRGFCAGVDRAISIVERALEEFGAPIYVRHEVVHNKFVVDNLHNKGAIFIDDLADVPEGATLIYSAHGVSKAVQAEAAARGFRVFDATCPLVTKVHKEVARLDEQDYQIVMIGHAGHVEVEGTMGQLPDGEMLLVEKSEDVAKLVVNNPDKLAYVSQTTLSVDETKDIIAALNARFPNIKNPHKEDICYATTNRQKAVKDLAAECNIVIVVGSPASSNSNRLREVAAGLGTDAYMVDNASFLQREWFEGKNKVGLTAGASAPEVLVQEVIKQIQAWGINDIQQGKGEEETIVFVLPKELRK
ncbi:4-hydroxy-3-methylbut-2-enyl diphosphate reductase [Kingella negevensis]|uniref:4-hydroxy-3-methylbut-2-enyl diphosphate reductase n=1 Tax=Kingella negevensis TaxID=1522312 RepID=UPI0025502696|nr:4-hydroxy-3-methylbut-2-enyl diphosphate reductase [Kingella negevensis]MDK4679511.1 4-hydroxy-3-methylbut-2-enyl diphosphate reductase [Kingella negevensis]MDK4682771.1 4-hydroxy-3-methylbut-2-enyl diphosphate reductase [Kingella negevensis]MDK4690968.1 4-hydroxy-3-methylbut-2-enyl diphosphate reductase [Kingella negevensis]MDK4693885.1 4-hydroxy-3-methylbut-2-enyl diphosphate reductase [Kingella negevensis]MDK4700209.1 4-hydroxy-3-methylbut-2-enyl diphosphate reductase [Kingella negevensi